MKKYLWYLKQLHNTAVTLIIIPGIESTATVQSADATSVSPPLQQSTVGANSTATNDKSETMTCTKQYKNNNIEKYKTTVKALALVDAQITGNVKRRREIMKLLAQLNLEKKCVDAAIDKDIVKKAYLEKEKYSILLHFDVPTELVSTHIPSSKLQSTDNVSTPSTPTHKSSTLTIQRAQNFPLQRNQTLLSNLLLQVMQRSSCFKRKMHICIS